MCVCGVRLCVKNVCVSKFIQFIFRSTIPKIRLQSVTEIATQLFSFSFLSPPQLQCGRVEASDAGAAWTRRLKRSCSEPSR